MSVTVLATNGRRQVVKITPNTTILEIIEEVCQKHDLHPEEYDLKHHRNVLPYASTVRFTGVPQNAHLELVPAKTPRIQSTVTLCLQLENGSRKLGDGQPSESLWSVITRIEPDILELAHPVLIYMRREVRGKEELEKTTLHGIGLIGGRAIVRILNRTLEELRTQANVSAPLTRPPPPQPSEPVQEQKHTSPIAEMPIPIETAASEEKSEAMEVVTVTTKATSEDLVEADEPKGSGLEVVSKPTESPSDPVIDVPAVDGSNGQSSGTELPQVTEMVDAEDSMVTEAVTAEKVILLGERNAVAYNTDSMPVTESADLPDDFFELTIKDVRSLYAAARRNVDELNNAPLLTKEQRDLDRDGVILQKLSQYKSCVIRIRFPDRTVLQGCFRPIETVATVIDFVREYLEDKELDFYLYSAPPKQVLEASNRLIEADCVPSAVLYLGFNKPELKPPAVFLRSDVVGRFSSPIAAFQAANETRGIVGNPTKAGTKSSTQSNLGPAPSSSRSAQNSSRHDSPPQKIPKWLKLAK